jgi:hypothetical protein
VERGGLHSLIGSVFGNLGSFGEAKLLLISFCVKPPTERTSRLVKPANLWKTAQAQQNKRERIKPEVALSPCSKS